MKILAEHACFGGVQGFYEHASHECSSPMRFSVYRPPQHGARPLPVLYYLAGLTCTEETFAIKPERSASRPSSASLSCLRTPAGARRACRAMTHTGTSASAPASTSTLRSRRGRRITGCTATWWRSCPR